MATPTILIAHTDETTRDSIKKILTNEFPLVVVETPEAVLPVLNSKTSVALLLLDASTTENGLDNLLQEIRAIAPKLTIIALVNEVNEEDGLEAVRQGANGYIFTPVKTDELRTIVEQTMAKTRN